MVKDENGKVYDQAFFIEWISHFCQKCQTLGHMHDEGQLTEQGGHWNNRRKQTAVRPIIVEKPRASEGA